MMQNLNFSLLDEPIKCQNLTAFVIEDVNVFASTVREIYRYEDCSSLKLFDEKYKPLKPSELMIITDILGYDINSSATLKLIYGDLEKQLNEKPEVKSMIEKLTATISELVGYELLDHELDLQEDEITVQELFKALGIKIETESDTIFEKIYEILQVFKYLSKKKLLIFINLCSYVTTEELRELSSYVSLYNMDVLLIEPRMLKGCSQYILDEDYFLTFENMV